MGIKGYRSGAKIKVKSYCVESTYLSPCGEIIIRIQRKIQLQFQGCWRLPEYNYRVSREVGLI